MRANVADRVSPTHSTPPAKKYANDPREKAQLPANAAISPSDHPALKHAQAGFSGTKYYWKKRTIEFSFLNLSLCAATTKCGGGTGAT
jgi:hypothetical protein